VINEIELSSNSFSCILDQIEALRSQLQLENDYLQKEINDVKSFGDIIGNSPPLINVFNQVDLVAPTDATVVIQGESGTGKELIAREIHRRSGFAWNQTDHPCFTNEEHETQADRIFPEHGTVSIPCPDFIKI